MSGEQGAQNIAYAVSSQTAIPYLDQWRTSPQPQYLGSSCSSPTGPSGESDVGGGTPDSDLDAVKTTLSAYFGAINEGDWETAWLQYTEAEQQRAGSRLAFAEGNQSSYDSNITIYDAQFNYDSTADIFVTFTSIQESQWGPNGDTCDNWNLDYQMDEVDGTWLINSVIAPDGASTHTTC